MHDVAAQRRGWSGASRASRWRRLRGRREGVQVLLELALQLSKETCQRVLRRFRIGHLPNGALRVLVERARGLGHRLVGLDGRFLEELAVCELLDELLLCLATCEAKNHAKERHRALKVKRVTNAPHAAVCCAHTAAPGCGALAAATRLVDRNPARSQHGPQRRCWSRSSTQRLLQSLCCCGAFCSAIRDGSHASSQHLSGPRRQRAWLSSSCDLAPSAASSRDAARVPSCGRAGASTVQTVVAASRALTITATGPAAMSAQVTTATS